MIRCPHCQGRLEIVVTGVGTAQPTSLDQELAKIASDINYAASLDIDKRFTSGVTIHDNIKRLRDRGVARELLAPMKDRVLTELMGLTEEQLRGGKEIVERQKEMPHVIPE